MDDDLMKQRISEYEIVRFLELLPNSFCRVRSADGRTMYTRVFIDFDIVKTAPSDVIPGTYLVITKKYVQYEGIVLTVLNQTHIYLLLMQGNFPSAFIEAEYIIENFRKLAARQACYARDEDNILFRYWPEPDNYQN